MKAESHAPTRYLPSGDRALLVEFGDTINSVTNLRVIALAKAMTKAAIKEVEEIVPTYRSLLVRYNPLETTYEQLVFRIKDIERTVGKKDVQDKGQRIVVPVVYGGEFGPDLGYVARHSRLTEEQVALLHCSREYRVYMIGFVPGFPYLGEVADEIATPRLETPRLKVPAGSVGIAERQTGIYPCEAPGGWRIIGRTPLVLFNPLQQPPTPLKAGDTIEFKPILAVEFEALAKAGIGITGYGR